MEYSVSYISPFDLTISILQENVPLSTSFCRFCEIINIILQKGINAQAP